MISTMDPTAGKNYRSPQEKNLFPGFPRSRQGNRKSGIFPCQLTGNYFHGFSGVFSWLHQNPESVGVFSLFFHREFFSPCFSGFFSWAHQCLVLRWARMTNDFLFFFSSSLFSPPSTNHMICRNQHTVTTATFSKTTTITSSTTTSLTASTGTTSTTTTDAARPWWRCLTYGLETSASPAAMVPFLSLLFFFTYFTNFRLHIEMNKQHHRAAVH